jgi:hypothetical protein
MLEVTVEIGHMVACNGLGFTSNSQGGLRYLYATRFKSCFMFVATTAPATTAPAPAPAADPQFFYSDIGLCVSTERYVSLVPPISPVSRGEEFYPSECGDQCKAPRKSTIISVSILSVSSLRHRSECSGPPISPFSRVRPKPPQDYVIPSTETAMMALPTLLPTLHTCQRPAHIAGTCHSGGRLRGGAATEDAGHPDPPFHLS